MPTPQDPLSVKVKLQSTPLTLSFRAHRLHSLAHANLALSESKELPSRTTISHSEEELMLLKKIDLDHLVPLNHPARELEANNQPILFQTKSMKIQDQSQAHASLTALSLLLSNDHDDYYALLYFY